MLEVELEGWTLGSNRWEDMREGRGGNVEGNVEGKNNVCEKAGKTGQRQQQSRLE